MPILMWIWKNKRWSLIILLLCYALFQTWQSNSLSGDLANAKTECAAKVEKEVTKAKKPFLDAQEKAKVKAEEVSQQYESTKAEDRIKTEVITRTVQKIVERPIYLNTCFDDDGVSAVNAAADTSELETAVP